MKDLNQKLLNIWEIHNQNYTNLVPQFYDNYIKNSNLIIGLNPSFSESGYRKFLHGSRFQNWMDNLEYKFSLSYFMENRTDELIKDYIEIENLSKKQYGYYKTFNKITPNWQYIDLFHIRVTQQNQLKSLYKKDTLFLRKQLELTIEMIKQLEPRQILVVNAFASDLLQAILNPTFNNKWGTFEVFDKPIFFSGMLSGMGCIDKGSFRRLQWHFNYVHSLT